MVYDNANVLLKTYYKTELSVTTDTCNKLAIDFPLMLINVVNLQLPFFFWNGDTYTLISFTCSKEEQC